mmetsp:Transcript_77698/g.197424  ORF Transcript_77698/g.197424 Transcript_77698/m.197424 type:complete len:262 (+) Transcript_77698:85-870(+)
MADGAVLASESDVKRYPKADIEEFAKSDKKIFCKAKCAECGDPATKRFKDMMSVMIVGMLDTFWCRDCGRVLCQSHRYQHTCEILDRQKERNKTITHEQLAAQIAEAEARRQAFEDEQRGETRRVAEAEEEQRLIRKDRRQILAKKAKVVEDFLQGITRDTEGAAARRGMAVRNELLEMYPKAKRIALTLYNEYLHPTTKDLADEDWQDVKKIYQRATELTGMFVSVEGEALDMRNPWDPPATTPEQAADAEGAGFGRGLL